MKSKSRLQAYNLLILIIICVMFLAVIALIGILKLVEQTIPIMTAFTSLCGVAMICAGIPSARKAIRESILSSKADNPEVAGVITKGMEGK